MPHCSRGVSIRGIPPHQHYTRNHDSAPNPPCGMPRRKSCHLFKGFGTLADASCSDCPSGLRCIEKPHLPSPLCFAASLMNDWFSATQQIGILLCRIIVLFFIIDNIIIKASIRHLACAYLLRAYMLNGFKTVA